MNGSPEADVIVAEYQTGVSVYSLSLRYWNGDHRRITDLLQGRGVLRTDGVKRTKPKPTSDGVRLLASCLLVSLRFAKRKPTPEEMDRMIDAVREYSGGRVCRGTGEYERKGGVEGVNGLRRNGDSRAAGS